MLFFVVWYVFDCIIWNCIVGNNDLVIVECIKFCGEEVNFIDFGCDFGSVDYIFYFEGLKYE